MQNKYDLFLKRLFDFFLSFFLILVFSLPMLIITLMIKLTSAGNILYWSERMGKGQSLFWMPKFRTMHSNTPQLATHLLSDIDNRLTFFGKFLRKTSLDELPQLFSIFKGDMSFVGPRPALFNQEDLINLRLESGVNELIPGLTGWAQINGRDNIPIERKAEFDLEYLKKRSLFFDIKIIFLTVFNILASKDISH